MPLILLAVVVLGFMVLPSGQAQIQDILQQPEIAANVAGSVGERPAAAGGCRSAPVLRGPTSSLAVLLAWAIGAVVAALSRAAPAKTSEVSTLTAGEATPEVSGRSVAGAGRPVRRADDHRSRSR